MKFGNTREAHQPHLQSSWQQEGAKRNSWEGFQDASCLNPKTMRAVDTLTPWGCSGPSHPTLLTASVSVLI